MIADGAFFLTKRKETRMQNYYLLGSPIAHSLSPAMHNCAFRALHMDAAYGLLDTPEDGLSATVERLLLEGAKGFNVTMPHKSAMVAHCKVLSDAAEIGGSVNTVRNEHGVLHGFTTDGDGFLRAMAEEGFPVRDARLTLLGTGGAASSILIACALTQAESIRVFFHRESSCGHILKILEKLGKCTRTRVSLLPLSDRNALADALLASDVLINATNAGMANTPLAGLSPIPESVPIPERLLVFDAIYNPRTTPLLENARKAGCRTANGLSMLLYQGAEAFRIWTGREMPVDEVRRVVFPNG